MGGNHHHHHFFTQDGLGNIIGWMQIGWQFNFRKENLIFTGLQNVILDLLFIHPQIYDIAFGCQQIRQSSSPASAADNTDLEVFCI